MAKRCADGHARQGRSKVRARLLGLRVANRKNCGDRTLVRLALPNVTQPMGDNGCVAFIVARLGSRSRGQALVVREAIND